jgi:serine/threonine-protein kinase RsbW
MNSDESSNTINSLQLEIPAAYGYLHIIGACISGLLESELALPEKEITSYNIELAVHEACSNIIGHAYAGLPGRIKLIFTVLENPGKIVIELYDNGRSFDFLSTPIPNLDEPQVRGYGLFLMQELMDQVEYCVKDDGNYWRMTKNLEHRESPVTSLARRNT